MRTHPGWIEAEVYFRIVHAPQVGHNDVSVATYREQSVEIALGPMGAFENGNIGALRRRMLSDKVVSAVLPPRGKPKPPRDPRTPRVVELLRKAIEWQALLESGKVVSQAEIARQEGITRVRVTQVLRGGPRNSYIQDWPSGTGREIRSHDFRRCGLSGLPPASQESDGFP